MQAGPAGVGGSKGTGGPPGDREDSHVGPGTSCGRVEPPREAVVSWGPVEPHLSPGSLMDGSGLSPGPPWRGRAHLSLGSPMDEHGLTRVRGPLCRSMASLGLGSPMEEQGSPEPWILYGGQGSSEPGVPYGTARLT